ncbi:hypothetical protein SAMN02799624_05325 [Paenibacillus sp. UNC496MF]|uniref:hypothetical protein n=1 Tax=Paenibacillus sp. UNC496MF TaxID=1502753 RepID=UPI0008F30AAE|nr:hypothetical protein [Paenibacillus sp. UNC496MF]SFJ64180.1 hypothetical protein SAMN02799624_05325 [Paenibacillus sp. UNC496MF]
MNIGDKVTWKHHAKGKHKDLTGKVIAEIAPDEDGFTKLFLVDKLSLSRIQFEKGVKTYRRLLVEVERGGKSTLSDFYAPNADSVKLA